jgi:hypothetical protein
VVSGPLTWQTSSVALKRASDPDGFSRVAGLDFGLTAPAGSWPTLTVKGGVKASASSLVTTANQSGNPSGALASFATIAVSDLGTVSIPSQSVPSITETSDWSFVKLAYSGMFDVTLSRATAAMLVETSQTSLRLFGGTVTKRTTNGTTITETAGQTILPKYVMWHEAVLGYRVATVASAPNISLMDQPWLLVWWGSQSHWLDSPLPMNYSHNMGQGWQRYPQRYGYQADCPVLMVFSHNPTAITQSATVGVGGVDITLPVGAKKVSALPLFGRVRPASATTNTWVSDATIPPATKTQIAAWYPRLHEFPASIAESYSYTAGTDTASILETITWTQVRSGGTKFAPIPPVVGTARDATMTGLTLTLPSNVDGALPTEYGPSLGVVGANSYAWTLSGLNAYIQPRAAPGAGAVPAAVTSRLEAQVDTLISQTHWSPWYQHGRTPGYSVSGDVHWSNPADGLALASELVPVVSGTRRTNLIAWLTAERTAYPPETVYKLTGSTGTNRGPSGIPNSQGDLYFEWSSPHVFSRRVWLWNAWSLARYYQVTGASLSTLNLTTSFLANGGTLDQDMAEIDWATGHWLVQGTLLLGTLGNLAMMNGGDKRTAVENANRHWAGLAGLTWLANQKGDANEPLLRALLAKATITRIAMAHLPRWQASKGLIDIPGDLGSAQANAEWLMSLAGNFEGFVYPLSWTSSADDPRVVVKLNQYEAFLDDTTHRWGHSLGMSNATQPPYRDMPRALASLLQAAVGLEATVYARKWNEFHPQWWMPFPDAALSQEHGIPSAQDAHGLFLAHAWHVGTAPATLERWTAYPWLDSGGDLYYTSKLAETARAYAASSAPIGPVIGSLTTNIGTYPDSLLPVRSKYEITIPITTTATTKDLPYDGTSSLTGLDTTTGISVDVLVTEPDGVTVHEYPAFHHQGYTSQLISGREFIYPDGTDKWTARLSFPEAGTWQGQIRATDATGTTLSGTFAVDVIASAAKGFVGVSTTDPRYFEFENGEWAPCLGIGDSAQGINKISPLLDTLIPAAGTNGLQMMRAWIAAMCPFGSYASPWRSYWKGGDSFYSGVNGVAASAPGYLPQAGHDVALNLWEGAASGVGGTNAAVALGGFLPGLNVKPSTTYRVSAKYLIPTALVASTVGQAHGFTIKAHTSFIANPWLSTSAGTTLFTPITDSPRVGGTAQWATVTANWTTSTVRWPEFVLVLQNCKNATMWVDDIAVQEDLGGGNYGPNIVSKPSMDMHKYVSQDLAFRVDEWIAVAEANGVTLKLVLNDKNDSILSAIDLTTGVFETGVLDNDNFYGHQSGADSKVRWLLRAWWRYAQARWGYSSAVHSWELLNEGNPAHGGHFRLADDFSEYMHSFEFARHMAVTSFWFGLPGSNFWSSASYPNADYVDIHQYVSTSPAIYGSITVNHPGGPASVTFDNADYYDTAHEHTNVASLLGPDGTAGVSGKPIIRAETGLVDTASTDNSSTEINADTAGVWYHKHMWAQADSGALHEMIFHANPAVWSASGFVHDHRPIARRFYNWITQFPVNNGHYVDAAATATDANLRLLGQKDLTSDKVHLWIDNQTHTWKSVVDGQAADPATGTVSVSGLSNGTYSVIWKNPYTGGTISGEQYVVSSGTLTATLPTAVSTDIAMQASLLAGSTATITPPLITNVSTVYAPSLSGGLAGEQQTGGAFTGALGTAASRLGNIVLARIAEDLAITMPLIVNTTTVYGPLVSLGIAASPGPTGGTSGLGTTASRLGLIRLAHVEPEETVTAQLGRPTSRLGTMILGLGSELEPLVQHLTMPLITNTSTVHAPTVTFAPIVVPLITNVSRVYAPTVTGGIPIRRGDRRGGRFVLAALSRLRL